MINEKVKDITLDDVADIISGVPIYKFKDKKGKLQNLILQKSVTENSLGIEIFKEHLTGEIESKYFSTKGDIIFKLQNPNLARMIEEDGFIITSIYAIIRIKENYDATFLLHLLNSQYVKKQLNIYTEGRKSLITISNLRNINLPDIPLEKQVDYASLLSSMDKMIELKKKDVNYEQHLKDGVINSIMDVK